MRGLQYLRRMLVMAAMALCLTFAVAPATDCYAAAQPEVQATTATEDEETFFFLMMGGGFLVILFAVAASVASVSSIIGIVGNMDVDGE